MPYAATSVTRSCLFFFLPQFDVYDSERRSTLDSIGGRARNAELLLWYPSSHLTPTCHLRPNHLLYQKLGEERGFTWSGGGGWC